MGTSSTVEGSIFESPLSDSEDPQPSSPPCDSEDPHPSSPPCNSDEADDEDGTPSPKRPAVDDASFSQMLLR